MSAILEAVLSKISGDVQVQQVGVYVHATAVVTRHVGLAYTFPKRSLDETRDRHEIVANHGKLTEFVARDLARYALSKHLLEASVGVAAINSLIDPPMHMIIERNGVDLLMERAAGKRLAVIGHFPFVARIRPIVRTLWVFELDPKEGDLPAAEAPNIIPHAEVVAITATTLINHTLDDLLRLAKGKQIILMGPSTIMSPTMFNFEISALCGVKVTDPDIVIRHLSEGGSFRHLPGVKYITMLSR